MIGLVAGPALGVEHKFDGVYSGKRSLVKGSGPTCPAEESVSLTIRGETLTFTNSVLKKFTIAFYPNPDGSFGQIYVDEGGDTVNIKGRVTGDVIEADVTNPPCAHHWHLQKEHRGQ
jgi:hypothetical protein